MSWTDSHAHLFDPAFDADRAAVLRRARDAQVGRLVVVGCEPSSWQEVVHWSSLGGGRVGILGLHPSLAEEVSDQSLEELGHLLPSPGIRALGEVGLDYHWTPFSPARQRQLLDAQLAMAEAVGLPVVIHERDAFPDLLAALSGVRVPVLLHCFSHGPTEAEAALARGYFLSFAGPITFPKAETLRQALVACPAERLLLETDAPYLSPHPGRGNRNEPARVAVTGAMAARVRQVSPDELMASVSAASQAFFGDFEEMDASWPEE